MASGEVAEHLEDTGELFPVCDLISLDDLSALVVNKQAERPFIIVHRDVTEVRQELCGCHWMLFAVLLYYASASTISQGKADKFSLLC